jgi:hypothetical protein
MATENEHLCRHPLNFILAGQLSSSADHMLNVGKKGNHVQACCLQYLQDIFLRFMFYIGKLDLPFPLHYPEK